MRNRSLMITAALGLCIAIAGVATAIDWAGLVKEARARHERLQAEIKDLTLQQVMETITEQGKIQSQMTIYTKGDKSRAEVQTELAPGMGKMENIVIGDGKDYWLVSPMMGTQKVPREEGEKYASDWEWWDRVTSDARVVGEEKVNGRSCYAVQGTPKEGSPFSKLWIDKDAFLLVKAEGKAEGMEKPMSVQCSDFRAVHKDFEIPFRTDVYIEGKLASTTRVTSAKVNTGLADDLFDPKKAKPKGPSMKDMMKMMERQQP
ncbi:MAG: outer membrane lipoprotein-sorting protein [bacterium]|jgi:outer membrane lipoprotein-sorting protein|nr:outer membrane lipoprotein-sorting protein [candidate division KSB1 bacterium]MDH7560437.1 outer membrane lipoprotein-sorting protein [bacterium]